MKYIIYDLNLKQWFIGSDLEGSYFSDEERGRYFDSEDEAKKRLIEEMKYKPSSFFEKVITILPIYNYIN